jgi:hypothetical protein
VVGADERSESRKESGGRRCGQPPAAACRTRTACPAPEFTRRSRRPVLPSGIWRCDCARPRVLVRARHRQSLSQPLTN